MIRIQRRRDGGECPEYQRVFEIGELICFRGKKGKQEKCPECVVDGRLYYGVEITGAWLALYLAEARAAIKALYNIPDADQLSFEFIFPSVKRKRCNVGVRSRNIRPTA